ncbi:MAG TPA: DUF881 domain-containing protein [Bacillales bacterium]|nr:DUF881 domain-containing protein [Bacillales bacterium]
MKRKNVMFAALSCVLGFAIVVGFGKHDAVQHEFREAWKFRNQLTQEKELTVKLNRERRQVEQLLNQYENNEKENRVETMIALLAKYKAEAGLTEVSGQGIVIHIEPLVSGTLIGKTYHSLTAELLRELLNDLNMSGAKQIAIAGQRVVAMSPIRNVNGRVYVNDHPIPDIPIDIKVLTDNAQQMKEALAVSESARDLAIHRLNLSIEIKDRIVLEPFDQPIAVHFMKPVKEDS